MPVNNPLHDLPPWDGNEYDREVRAERAGRRPAADAPSRSAPQRAWPKPKPQANGRWAVQVRHKRRDYRATFNTEQEAAEFIKQIKES